MATGSLADGVCYETALEATDAYFSGFPPFTFNSGTSTSVVSYLKVATVWNKQQVTTTNKGVVTVNYTVPVTAPVFPACDSPTEFFNTGVSVGAAIVGVLVIGWAFHALAKAL